MRTFPLPRMKRSSGFYDWAWDTIVGCKNGCPYCYARHIIEKKGWKFDEIRYFLNLWDEPSKVPPSKIFVNHFSDIMGSWVHKDWIDKIIDTAKSLPEHEFLFMTKNPMRYFEFQFPSNCILGVTIENPDKWWRALIMENYKGRKMCSVEPILGDFTGKDFSQFELVVVGYLEKFDKSEPDKKYYDTVKHTNIFYK